MYKRRIKKVFILFVLICTPMEVFANSSWQWFTRNPLPLLPWVIIGTLIVETFILCYFNKIAKIRKVFIIILTANIVSFLIPYACLGIPEGGGMEYGGFFEQISYMAEKSPAYIIGMIYFVLTLISEIPIVYFSLKNHVRNKKRFFILIIFANTITTLIIAVLERITYKGSW